MTSMNSKDETNMAPTADSKPSVLSKRNFRIQSFHSDDMGILLENVYSLHQEVSNESSQLKLQYSELVTVNQELVDKNQHLQKQCDHLSNENEILKEELARLKLRLSHRELLDTDNCSVVCQLPEEQSDPVEQIRPFQKKSLDTEQENKGKSLPSKPCHELLFSSKETHDLRALDTSCVSAVQHFILPDTNDCSETHPKLKCNKTIIQRPNIVIPETVPMDCIEEESDLLKPVGIYSTDPKISQHVSDVQESEMGNQPLESELVSEETLKPLSDGNKEMQTLVEPMMSEEPGSPVFDRFREVKSVQKKSLDSPTLFDEEDECSLRSVRKPSGSCFDTPVRGSVVIQTSKVKHLNASFKKEIHLDDTKNINCFDNDSMNCSSPSVISGGTRVNCPKLVSGGETNSGIYLQHCQNNETNDLVSHVKSVASSDLDASVLLLQQKPGFSENHLIPGVYPRRLSRFSLKHTDKADAKENRMFSDVELEKSAEPPPFCKNRRKRQRPSDPDETFCALGTSVLENSACESTHYVAPGESMLEHSVSESTHFVAPGDTMLENNSPAICNLDSLATVYVNSKTSPDVQLTFSELEREIVTCVPSTDLHKSDYSKTLLSDDNRQQRGKEAFKIPKRMRRDSSIDSHGYSPELQHSVELAENCDRIPECDASSSVQMKLDNPMLIVESPAESQESQCLLDHPSSFALPAHESLQLDQLKDYSLVDEAMRAASVDFKLNEMDDSFDRIPKADNIGYAYLDVVRKQHERRQLDGFACVQCEQWYRGLDLTDEQIKERLKACRHKARFQPTSTPEHYWSIGFPDTQQCNERGYLNVGPVSPSKHRRKKGLRVLFESNKERLKERKRKQQSLEQCLKRSNQSPSLSK